MLTPQFSRDIASIFNSNDLTDDIKYDVTCRLVCDSLGVSSVSIVIYDVKTDNLKCKGSYLSPNYHDKYNCKNETYRIIMENIMVFEFFDSSAALVSQHTYQDFTKTALYGEKTAESTLGREEFDVLKKMWDQDGMKQHYRNYKYLTHNEFYEIKGDSISARYFKKLLDYNTELTTEIEIEPDSSLIADETLIANWRKVGVDVPVEKLFYIGLPLFATERYTGIIRIMGYYDIPSTINVVVDHKISKYKESLKDGSFQMERLSNFAQLISLHLKTNYYLEGFSILSNLKVDGDSDLKIDKGELDKVCNILTDVIKCNGCIIRFADDPADAFNPPIKGISDSLKIYVNHINDDPQASFSEDIYGLLKKYKSKREKQVRAINFSIPLAHNTNTFNTIEYYYDADNRINSDTNQTRTFRDFTPEYLALLRRLKMIEIVVLKLEFVDSGFLILSNTKHRKFTHSDIEMILLASKRVGLEIKHQEDSERIREQNKIIATDEHAKIIIHQVGAPARALSGHAQNLNDGVIKTQDIPMKVTQIYRLSLALLRKINTLQKYLDWETKKIVPKKDSSYNIEDFIRTRAKQFEGLMVGSKIRIWTFIENPNNFSVYTHIDSNLLDEVVNCILDNAVKYSFNYSEMQRHKVNFDPTDVTSDGHIQVWINSTADAVILRFINFGAEIESREFERIFERGVRGNKQKSNGVSGSGIGLYLVQKIIQSLMGKITVAHDIEKHKTCFTVLIPQNEGKTNPHYR